MEDNEYNKLGRLYQFINNDFIQRHYNYGGVNGDYKTYHFDDVQFPDDTLQLIDKLMTIKVSDFYNIVYLKSHNYPEKYYDAELVKKSDIEYGFHYELPTILFYYILNRLKSAATEFLKVIESKEFIHEFDNYIKKDEYLLQYSNHIHY